MAVSGHEPLHQLHGDSTLAGIASELLALDESGVPQDEATTDHHLHHADANTLHARMIEASVMTVDEIGTSTTEDGREALSIVTASETVMTDETTENEGTTVRTVKNEPTAKTEKVCSNQTLTPRWKEHEADTRISERFSGPCSRRTRYCGIAYTRQHPCSLEDTGHQSFSV